MRRMSASLMPLWKPYSKSILESQQHPPFCGPRGQAASHASAAPTPHPDPSQVEGRLASPMGTQNSLLVDSWSLHGSSQAQCPVGEDLRSGLGDGKTLHTKEPSAGPSVCPTHHQLLPKDGILCLLPGPALQLAPSLPAVTIHYLTFHLVAKRLVLRQKEEGDSAKR